MSTKSTLHNYRQVLLMDTHTHIIRCKSDTLAALRSPKLKKSNTQILCARHRPRTVMLNVPLDHINNNKKYMQLHALLTTVDRCDQSKR